MNIEEAMKKCQVMSKPNDSIVQSMILNHWTGGEKNPKLVMELGSGSGGWSRFMHFLGATNIDYILLEDFSWAKSGYADSRFYWPYDKEDFLNFMNRTDDRIFIENLIDKTVNNAVKDGDLDAYKNNVLAVRVDCDIDYNDLVFIVDNCLEPEGFVIIDDCKVNCGLKRILSAIDLLQDKKCYPVFAGDKEMMLCKSRERAYSTQDSVIEKIENYNNIYSNLEIVYSKNIDEIRFLDITPFKVYVESGQGKV